MLFVVEYVETHFNTSIDIHIYLMLKAVYLLNALNHYGCSGLSQCISNWNQHFKTLDGVDASLAALCKRFHQHSC